MRNVLALLPALLLLACSDGGTSSTGDGGSGGTGGATSTTTGGGGAGGAGSGGDGGGGATTMSMADETVTPLQTPCSKIPPKSTKCESFEVVCEGLVPAVVDLATYEPPAGAAIKGTIVFGSGGEGTGFYNFAQMNDLLDAGYRVIDRRWPEGWFTNGTDGPQQTACRLAAVLRHLRATVAAEGALCATGNSGGSAELGYALTWQGAGASLDFAMPTSGPFHRLDLACQGEADAAWPGQCAETLASSCADCASMQCQLGSGPRVLIDKSFSPTPKCTAPAEGDLEILKARSPELGPHIAGLGGLPIRFLIGKLDTGAYAPLTQSLTDSLLAAGASVEISYVAGADHEMDTSVEGSDAIRDALLESCAP